MAIPLDTLALHELIKSIDWGKVTSTEIGKAMTARRGGKSYLPSLLAAQEKYTKFLLDAGEVVIPTVRLDGLSGGGFRSKHFDARDFNIDVYQDDLNKISEVDYAKIEARILADMQQNLIPSPSLRRNDPIKANNVGVAIGGPLHGQTIEYQYPEYRVPMVSDRIDATDIISHHNVVTYFYHHINGYCSVWCLKSNFTEAVTEIVRYAAKKNRRKKRKST